MKKKVSKFNYVKITIIIFSSSKEIIYLGGKKGGKLQNGRRYLQHRELIKYFYQDYGKEENSKKSDNQIEK